MSQEKRFGKRIALPSTLQIVRELKTLMRHDAELDKGVAVAGARQDDILPVASAALSQPDAR